MVELKNKELLNIDGGCTYIVKMVYYIKTTLSKLFRAFIV